MDNVGNCPIGNNDEQIKNRIDITAAVPATDIVLTAHGNDLAIHPSTVQQNMMGLIISDESSDGGDNNNNSTISSNDSNTAATKISTFGLEDNNEKSVVVVMSEIIKSPYEIGACAEIGEYYFDELKNIMKPTTTTRAVLPHDDDDIISSDHTMIIIMNPKMENFFGDTLARALFKARLEIVKSGMVFSTSWREGKIRGNNFGWIPRKQVLLCLQEQLFVEANVTSLQAIVKNLDCVDLVLEAITTYNLTYEYPNLSSNKKERAFFFDTPETTKICCYKCVIFVARAFATLQILRKAHEINQSLTKNMKKCLSIINKHVRTNPKKVTELKHKSEQYFNSNNNNNNNNSKPNSKASKLKQCDQISKRRRSSVTASITSNRNRVDDEEAISATATSRRPCKKIRQSVVKSESLLLSFKIMQEQTQRISQTMDFFKTQLQDHRDILRGEIRDSIKKEDKASSGGNSSGR
jgi:hypothetical protein